MKKIHHTAEQIRLLFIHSIINITCFYKLILNQMRLFKRSSVTLKSTWSICVKLNNFVFVKRKLQASLRNQTCNLILCSVTKSNPEQHSKDEQSCVISLQTCTEIAVLGLKPFSTGTGGVTEVQSAWKSRFCAAVDVNVSTH